MMKLMALDGHTVHIQQTQAIINVVAVTGSPNRAFT